MQAQGLSGLEHVVDSTFEGDNASIVVQGSTVQARMRPANQIVSSVNMDDERPWALVAVLKKINWQSRAPGFLRDNLASAVAKALQTAPASPGAHTATTATVPPLSTALLRVASKFSNISRSESILTHTDSTIALLDVKAQRIYTVTCGKEARLPVVTDSHAQPLTAVYTNKRQLGPVVMEEATYEATPGNYNVVLGNPELWRFIHPTKASLYASTYATATGLSTSDHSHDAASSILRAALRTVVARCSASPSARTSVLNSLAQLDRLAPGSREESAVHGVVPRMRGDIHPDLSAAVLAASMRAPHAHSAADSAAHPTSAVPSKPPLAPWRRIQSVPEIADTHRMSPAPSPLGSQPGSPRTSNHAVRSPLAGGAPVATKSGAPLAHVRSHPHFHRRVPSADSALHAPAAAPSTPAQDGAAANPGTPATPPQPKSLEVGWLRTAQVFDTAFDQWSQVDSIAASEASVDGATPATTPRGGRESPLTDAPDTPGLSGAGGGSPRAGLVAAVSLPQRIISVEDFKSYGAAAHDAGHVHETPGACQAERCNSAGAPPAATESGAAGTPGGMPGEWGKVDLTRRWRLLQRHVQVLGLEKKLRTQMWKEAVDAARTHHSRHSSICSLNLHSTTTGRSSGGSGGPAAGQRNAVRGGGEQCDAEEEEGVLITMGTRWESQSCPASPRQRSVANEEGFGWGGKPNRGMSMLGNKLRSRLSKESKSKWCPRAGGLLRVLKHN